MTLHMILGVFAGLKILGDQLYNNQAYLQTLEIKWLFKKYKAGHLSACIL